MICRTLVKYHHRKAHPNASFLFQLLDSKVKLVQLRLMFGIWVLLLQRTVHSWLSNSWLIVVVHDYEILWMCIVIKIASISWDMGPLAHPITMLNIQKTSGWNLQPPLGSLLHPQGVPVHLKKRSKVATEPKLTAKVTGSISRSSTKLTRVATNLTATRGAPVAHSQR